jgi:hypothetical protein
MEDCVANIEKPSLIIKRTDPTVHYECHYRNKVVFLTLEGEYLGISNVYSENDNAI